MIKTVSKLPKQVTKLFISDFDFSTVYLSKRGVIYIEYLDKTILRVNGSDIKHLSEQLNFAYHELSKA